MKHSVKNWSATLSLNECKFKEDLNKLKAALMRRF